MQLYLFNAAHNCEDIDPTDVYRSRDSFKKTLIPAAVNLKAIIALLVCKKMPILTLKTTTTRKGLYFLEGKLKAQHFVHPSVSSRQILLDVVNKTQRTVSKKN